MLAVVNLVFVNWGEQVALGDPFLRCERLPGAKPDTKFDNLLVG